MIFRTWLYGVGDPLQILGLDLGRGHTIHMAGCSTVSDVLLTFRLEQNTPCRILPQSDCDFVIEN